MCLLRHQGNHGDAVEGATAGAPTLRDADAARAVGGEGREGEGSRRRGLTSFWRNYVWFEFLHGYKYRCKYTWEYDVGHQLFDPVARRKTMSVTLNADLAVKPTAAGINISRTAERAVEEALRASEIEAMRTDCRAANAFTTAYVAEHGMPFDTWATLDDTEMSHQETASDGAA